MFLSAESRKNAENSVVLPEISTPKGRCFSPFKISLWDTMGVGAVHKSTKISGKSDGKVIKSPVIISPKGENTPVGETEFTAHALPETLTKVPSREDQIKKVKRAMSQFEELSKISTSSNTRTRSENSGFFRNLKKLM